MRRVFVTRTPSEGVIEQLRNEGYALAGESLLSFEPLPQPRIAADVDAVVFYSPRGAEHLSVENAALLRTADAPVIAAMGEGTATALRKRVIDPSIVGDGRADTLAASLRVLLRERVKHSGKPKLVFAQARESLRSVERSLGDEVDAISLTTYVASERIDVFVPVDSDVYWVTSPRSGRLLLNLLPRARERNVWAIGQTTRAALDALGVAATIKPWPSS